MSAKPHDGLSPKSSAGQLWAEVERLRSTTHDETVAHLTAAAERARTRETALLNELRAARAGATEEGVAGTRVAMKAAPAQLRSETWRRFADAVCRLPKIREAEGLGAVRLFIAKNLGADLDLLGLTAPRGPLEAKERDRLRRRLDSPAASALLSRSEPWADRHRVLFLAQARRAYFRPSVWAAFEKGADEATLDRWGRFDKG